MYNVILIANMKHVNYVQQLTYINENHTNFPLILYVLVCVMQPVFV